MMRKLNTSDFEQANIEYIEFWMMDPFIYTRGQTGDYSGDLCINLGEVSEDILKDGKKFYESGMPIDGDPTKYTETVWGRVPVQNSVTYAFNTSSGARDRQDIGLNGLSSTDEATFPTYKSYLDEVRAKVSTAVYDSIAAEPRYLTDTSMLTVPKAILRNPKTLPNAIPRLSSPLPMWKI